MGKLSPGLEDYYRGVYGGMGMLSEELGWPRLVLGLLASNLAHSQALLQTVLSPPF